MRWITSVLLVILSLTTRHSDSKSQNLRRCLSSCLSFPQGICFFFCLVPVCHSERNEESPHLLFARHSDSKSQNLRRCPCPFGLSFPQGICFFFCLVPVCHSERSEESPHLLFASHPDSKKPALSEAEWVRISVVVPALLVCHSRSEACSNDRWRPCGCDTTLWLRATSSCRSLSICWSVNRRGLSSARLFRP